MTATNNLPTINIVSSTVSIQVLKVGEKQMTQSFFKQIPEVRINDFGTLKKLLPTINILGHVNYFPDKDKNIFNKNYNIVFIENNELRRSYCDKYFLKGQDIKQLFIAL